MWVRVWLRAAQTERGNARGGATKKREISRTLLSINLHFLVPSVRNAMYCHNHVHGTNDDPTRDPTDGTTDQPRSLARSSGRSAKNIRTCNHRHRPCQGRNKRQFGPGVCMYACLWYASIRALSFRTKTVGRVRILTSWRWLRSF